MRSLKNRLTTNILIVSVLFYLFIIGLNVYFFNSFGSEFVRTRLEHDTNTLLKALSVETATGLYTVQTNEIDPVFLQNHSGHYYEITIHDQTIRSKSMGDFDIEVLPVSDGEITLSLVDGPAGQSLLLLNGRYEFDEETLQIAVSEDYSPIFENLKWLGLLISLLSVAAIILLSLMQRFAVAHGLSPLTKTKDDLAKLNKGDLQLMAEDVPVEIMPLVTEINQLLKLADNRILRSSNAIGNLAHSLKTPLSLLEHVLTSGALDIEEEKKKEMRDAIAAIQYQVESQLRKARIIGPLTRGQKVNIAKTLTPLIEMLRKVYARRDLVFTLEMDEGAEFSGDSHDMVELMGNLLDNACKWAKAEVAIIVGLSGDGTVIEVHDDGPGANPQVFSSMERRGARLDESADGHGIGLSIVKEITTLYNASVAFTKSERLGGLQVTITLPQS
ncbi:two-component sensor [Kordiimonas sediminis]|uniref:histidine kinase n=1 Tax=Kordiimonas sediminis TaxID=1735581 RepID=A0A919AKF9_9PROT|nr:ATP-binding protein [Kordiimonas sediminis]GHF13691.1 two-component sensor [Kordiimonas sediminis]